MNKEELLRKVRKIDLKARGLSKHVLAGSYNSSFKGSGMSFSEVRSYQHGDEIRAIDWNVTARFNEPFIKVFEEERESNLILVVDVSASMNVGSFNGTKSDLATEIAAVLAFSAEAKNDKIGLLLVSDQVEHFIPPGKGKKQVLQIIRTLLSFESKHKQTNLSEGLTWLGKIHKKRSIVCLLSDFNVPIQNDSKLNHFIKKHDVFAIKINDKVEKTIPSLGFIPLENAESGQISWINSSSKKMNEYLQKNYAKHQNETKSFFTSIGVDFTEIETGEDYLIQIKGLFKTKKNK